MEAINYVPASSVDEVVSVLSDKGDVARILCGGTDLLVALREGRMSAQTIVDVKGIDEVTELAYSSEKGLTLGAAVPCYRMYDNDEIANAYPGLIEARLCEDGQLKGHIAVAVSGEVSYRGLRQKLPKPSEIHFIPAISGR